MHHLAIPAPQPSPSSSSSSSSTRPQFSPPSLLSLPSTTTSSAHAHAHAHAHTFTSSSTQHHHTTTSVETHRHVAVARAAVVASISNLLDSELQSRAGLLHGNATALDKQERDVLRATDQLRREREKLAREADRAARKVKELGNVQNWAEVLERGFLVLEETVRLANRGEGSCSCSCSECEESDEEEEEERGRDRDGDGDNGPEEDDEERELDAKDVMDVDREEANSVHGGQESTTRMETGKDADPAVLLQRNGHLDGRMASATATAREAEECEV
ncbi:hypothetical protein E4U55_003062 [Claviceps digitariae]|nr:hypothetical protein E4U55_003062 [Claviceps digitariae]